MPSFWASRLAAISITDEIKIRMRGLRYPTNLHVFTQMNICNYSAPIPIPQHSKNAVSCVFSFQRKQIVQSGSKVNILNRKGIMSWKRICRFVGTISERFSRFNEPEAPHWSDFDTGHTNSSKNGQYQDPVTKFHSTKTSSATSTVYHLCPHPPSSSKWTIFRLLPRMPRQSTCE